MEDKQKTDAESTAGKVFDVKQSKKPLAKRLIRDVIIIFAIGIPSFYGYLYFFIMQPPGKGPAGPDIPQEPFAEVWSKNKVVLLGIGDSITDGYGSTGYGSTEGFSYFNRLVSNPGNDSEDTQGRNLSKVFPNLTANNISVSGSVSTEHLEKQILPLKQFPSDVTGIVVMTSGGNDIIHQYGEAPPKECAMYGATISQAEPWIRNFEKRLDQMVIEIKKRFPGGCHIFLANIYDPTDGTGSLGNTGLPPWDEGLSILAAYNEIISKCAEKHDFVHLVDIRTPFLGHGIHSTKIWNTYHSFSDPHCWYHPNIEDPNDRGYDAIRRLFLLEMIKVFTKAESNGHGKKCKKKRSLALQ